MDTKEVPPPYTSSPHQYRDGPQYVPTPQFQQPYMSQPQPTPQAPAAVMTNVTITGSPGAVAGSCPVCHNTSWTGSYSCCAWMWLILCFPIGIVCCCCMRKKKCSKCGFTLG